MRRRHPPVAVREMVVAAAWLVAAAAICPT